MVAHRSPLGVAGVPPSVATVRGTAGPEPMAMYLGPYVEKLLVAEKKSRGKKMSQWWRIFRGGQVVGGNFV